ncbi:S ribonuclease [Pyrus ussuriensis x Pyrus communis]|uniref:S ribonuclease n=1 Tax=Pyrus ussuriensis x Pyrus communis TaxID=2448454 RepID=A0A5N5HA80_9ROSA|nr:S ribonuclease [Pyrus ussuriensis x Pyrus communis]
MTPRLITSDWLIGSRPRVRTRQWRRISPPHCPLLHDLPGNTAALISVSLSHRPPAPLPLVPRSHHPQLAAALVRHSLNFGVPMEPEASELPKGLVLGRDGNIHLRITPRQCGMSHGLSTSPTTSKHAPMSTTVCKATISTDPILCAEDYIILVIYEDQLQLAFIRLKDTR